MVDKGKAIPGKTVKQVEVLTQKYSAGQVKKPQRKVKHKRKAKLSDKPTTETSKITTEDTDRFYKEVAERFPRLTLSAVLNTEKQFAEADGNNDGTIDLDELERVLDKCGLLFTKKQVQEILHTIDTDDSGTLDVMECLEIIDRITQNRVTDLPRALTQSTEVRSRLCSVQ